MTAHPGSACGHILFRPLTILLLAGTVLMLVAPGCRMFRRDRAEERDFTVSRRPMGDVEVAETHLAEAEAALNDGDEEKALEAFSAAIEENPRIFRAHMGMGDIYHERGEHEFAERSYRQAVELNPKSYEALYHHGLVLQLLNRLREAIREYRRALVINPDSHESNLNIATAYLQSGEASEALPFAEAASRLTPEHGPTHVNLGAIYAAIGRHDEAVEQYQSAMELMEPTPELILNLVESLRKVKKYPEMVNALEALLRLAPSAAAYERLGYAQFKLRDYNASVAAYREAMNSEEDYYPAMNGLAVNLLNQFIRSQRTDLDAQYEAVQLLRRSLQLNANQDRIKELLSRYGR